jgi:hypothetical protein
VVVVTPAATWGVAIVATAETLSAVAAVGVLVTLGAGGAHTVTGAGLLVVVETMSLEVVGVAIRSHATETALLVRLRRGKAALRGSIVGSRAGTSGTAKGRARSGSSLGVTERLQVIRS